MREISGVKIERPSDLVNQLRDRKVDFVDFWLRQLGGWSMAIRLGDNCGEIVGLREKNDDCCFNMLTN